MTNGDVCVRVRPNPLKLCQQNQTNLFPMDFDRSTIKQLMQHKQLQIMSSKRHMTNVSTESQQLMKYGKCRFDYAVSKSLHSDSDTGCARQRPSTCPASIHGKLTLNRLKLNNKGHVTDSGPSREGSVIYNKKALVLSAIRTQPSTVHSQKHPAAQGNSLLPNVSTPVYRLKVAESSVGGGSISNQSTVNYSEIVLLPENTCSIREFLADDADKQSDISNESNEQRRSNYRKPSIPILVQIDAPDSSDGDCDDDVPSNRLLERRPSSLSSARGSPRQSRGRKKSPSTAGRDGYRGKTADTLSPVSAGRRPSSVTRGRSKTKPAGTGRDRRNNSAGRRTLREESPTRLLLPGPHCWVDDVTVSSDIMDQEERGESPLIGIPKPSLNGPPRDKFLPDFLCPSSELKSRNVATKMWLRECSFLKADKAVPLI